MSWREGTGHPGLGQRLGRGPEVGSRQKDWEQWLVCLLAEVGVGVAPGGGLEGLRRSCSGDRGAAAEVCRSLGHLAGNLELIPQAGASAEASEPMGRSCLGGRVARSASGGVESYRLRGQEARSGEGEVVKSGVLRPSGPRGGQVPGAGARPVLADPAGPGGTAGAGGQWGRGATCPGFA